MVNPPEFLLKRKRRSMKLEKTNRLLASVVLARICDEGPVGREEVDPLI
jgi:hypothetical protein